MPCGLGNQKLQILSSKMSARSTTVLVLLLGIALATNPDDDSFKKYVDTVMRRSGSSTVERLLVTNLASLVYKRKDYKFFSIVNVPEQETNYLGIFGLWVPIPTLKALKDAADQAKP
ncbi:hypothetical protein BJ742DRAFT_835458 [Cladochytrium replicatum]|nr:hypothetical protein BJ742DRAFT_835458 [Cladochytrium replicatum]